MHDITSTKSDRPGTRRVALRDFAGKARSHGAVDRLVSFLLVSRRLSHPCRSSFQRNRSSGSRGCFRGIRPSRRPSCRCSTSPRRSSATCPTRSSSWSSRTLESGAGPHLRRRHLLHDVPPREEGAERADGLHQHLLHAARGATASSSTSRGGWGSRPARPRPTGPSRIVEEECLAACANAPMMICGDDYFLDLTPEKVDASLDELRKRLREPADASRRRSVGPCCGMGPGRREGLTWRRPGRTPRASRSSPRTSASPDSHKLSRLPAARRLRGAAQGADAAAGRAGRRGQEVEPARPRRRRLPDRDEVVVHPQGRQASSTWSSTPTSPSRAPARTASCSPTTRTC